MENVSSADRMAASRRKYQQQGLRQVSIWIPDTRHPNFAEQAYQQCLSLRDNPTEEETQDWLEKIADSDGWEA